ncbi:galactose mutarotase [Candidatus Woesebacteria bacterium]|nr:galactose mutarotase [Candidatus Woesebacteria bacterium]
MKIHKVELKNFDRLSTGETVENWELANDNGMKILLNSYGLTMTHLYVLDKSNILQDIVLHYDTIADYEKDSSMGRIAIGQYADLIVNATYIDTSGKTVKLHPNNGNHMLHGGEHGWAMRIWDIGETESNENYVSIKFCLHDSETGNKDKSFPGNIKAVVKVSLTNSNELCFEYTAITDKTTPIKMTNHSYYNLNGTLSQTTIDNHTLQTNADRYIDIDQQGIPTGEIVSANNTMFDFKTKKQLGNIFRNHAFDHCLLFPQNDKGTISLYSPTTGIRMDTTTDQPAVQFYNSVNLGKPFIQYGAFSIEPQQPIDYINHPQWHNQFGRPFTEQNSPYTSKITCYFSVEK